MREHACVKVSKGDIKKSVRHHFTIYFLRMCILLCEEVHLASEDLSQNIAHILWT